MNKQFQGIYAVVVTPFYEDGTFDVESAKKNLDWLIEQGVQGVCILGATGEYQSISDEEHMAYVKEIVPYVKDRVSVIVGASRERPEDVVKLVNNIKECGAHAAMVLPSFYCHPAQDEIVEHYRYIEEQTQFPIVAYNNPGSAGIEIGQDAFRQIMALPYTAIVKESSGSMQKLTEVLIDAPEKVSVFCGCDNLAYESFADGACGWILYVGKRSSETVRGSLPGCLCGRRPEERKGNLQRDPACFKCTGIVPKTGAGIEIRPEQERIKWRICQKTTYGIK